MIYVRLMGGIGNQMFQYAAARRLALERSTGVALDLSHYLNPPADETPREYEMGCFNLPARLTKKQVRPRQEGQPALKNFFSRRPTLIQEEGFQFNPKLMEAPDDSLLIGYWQSEKYFADHEDQIRRDFTFMQKMSVSKQEVRYRIEAEQNAVALQVRRGDFAHHNIASKFHGTVAMGYYQRAVTYLAEKIDKPVFFVISDDTEWCRENMKLDYPMTIVEHVPNTGWEDMWLFSLCKHQIIANSSYGWWAAWLNTNPDKKIIAPKQWFKGGDLDTEDLIPENWVKM